jgi:hypothetical protein
MIIETKTRKLNLARYISSVIVAIYAVNAYGEVRRLLHLFIISAPDGYE